MKKGQGKNKGIAFEREQARLFSLWITKGEDKDVLWRSVLSGGRPVIGAQYGDLALQKPHSEGEVFVNSFYVELKTTKSLDITSVFCSERALFRHWWAKCYNEAKKHKVEPMLIVKANHKPSLIFFSLENTYLFSFISLQKGIKYFIVSDMHIWGTQQKDLFNAVQWDEFKTINNIKIGGSKNGNWKEVLEVESVLGKCDQCCCNSNTNPNRICCGCRSTSCSLGNS